MQFQSVIGVDGECRGASGVECIESDAQRIEIIRIDLPSPALPCPIGREGSQKLADRAGIGIEFGGEFLRCHLDSLSVMGFLIPPG